MKRIFAQRVFINWFNYLNGNVYLRCEHVYRTNCVRKYRGKLKLLINQLIYIKETLHNKQTKSQFAFDTNSPPFLFRTFRLTLTWNLFANSAAYIRDQNWIISNHLGFAKTDLKSDKKPGTIYYFCIIFEQTLVPNMGHGYKPSLHPLKKTLQRENRCDSNCM